MSNKTPILRSAVLLFWSIALAGITVVMGAAPLRVIRAYMGPWPFLFLGLGFSLLFWGIKLYPLSAAFFVFTFLVVVYTELQERKFGLFESIAFSILVSSISMGATFFVWSQFFVTNWLKTLIAGAQSFIDKAATVSPDLANKLVASELILQIPSAIIVVIIISAALMVILERPLYKWAQLPFRRRERLADFTMPDYFIWIFIISLFGAFYEMGLSSVKFVSSNILNVVVVGYFFQGISIVSKYFEFYKVGSVWRGLWFLLLISQFFYILAIFGLADYWLNFRRFFIKQAAEIKRRDV